MRFSWAKLTVSLVLVVWYLAMPQYSFGWWWDYPECGAVCGNLLYPLSHANVWHLAANVLCLWMIPCELHLYAATFLSVLCSFLPCFITEATCGFSGVLFAIVGMSWGRVRRFRDMIWRNKWFLIIPIFIPHVNALLHVYCLLAGWVVGRYVPMKRSDWL